MKAQKIIFCLLTITFGFFSTIVRCQVGIIPDPTLKAACPGIDIDYKLVGYDAECHALAVENGSSIYNDQTKTLTVSWTDNGNKGKIRVILLSNVSQSCIPGQTWEVPILTLIGVDPPEIKDMPTSVPAGKVSEYTIKAEQQFKFRGSEDGVPFWVKDFNWVINGNATYVNATNSNNKEIKVRFEINPSTEVSVEATGHSAGCITMLAGQTKQTEKTVRTVDAPCPLTFPSNHPGYVWCEDVTPFVMNANPAILNELTGQKKYIWSVEPSTWQVITINPATASVVVVPDGKNSGKLTVRASLDDIVSNPCSIDIPLRVAYENTVVKGITGTFCGMEQFSIEPAPPQVSGVTWRVVPVVPGQGVSVTPSSGTGSVANLTADPVGQGGKMKIIFKVGTDNCGYVEFSKEFYAGKPNLGFPNPSYFTSNGCKQIYGEGCACPNCTYSVVYDMNKVGDSDNCLTWTPISGNTGFGDCNSYDFYLYNLGVAFRAGASNECGDVTRNFYFYPCGLCNIYGLTVYPNPARSILTIATMSEDNSLEPPEIGNVRLFNNFNRLVAEKSGPNKQIQLNVAGLPEGQYTLQVEIDGQITTEQIIVEPE